MVYSLNEKWCSTAEHYPSREVGPDNTRKHRTNKIAYYGGKKMNWDQI